MINNEVLKKLENVGDKIQDNDWIVTLVPGGWIYLNKKYSCCTMVEFPGSDSDTINLYSQSPITEIPG